MIVPIVGRGRNSAPSHVLLARSGPRRRDDARFELTDFDAAEQLDLIETARDLLVAAGAPAPVAFRSGSYAVNGETLDALARLGLRYDSSHNGTDHPWPSALPLAAALMDPAECGGVVEIPISQIAQRGGGLRHLQICALSSREMEAALRHAARNDHSVTTIVGHSFELASRDGRRVNRLVRARFDRLCAYLEANAEAMPTATFAGLEAAAPARAARPLPVRPLRTALRMAEQAWGTARYEKPLLGAALVALPPLAALEELVIYAGL